METNNLLKKSVEVKPSFYNIKNNKTIKILIILFMFFICSCYATTDVNNSEQINTQCFQEYQSDIEYLIEKLEKIHPIFTYNEYKYFDIKKLHDYKSIIDEKLKKHISNNKNDKNKKLNNMKFYYILSEFLGKLPDGHISINLITKYSPKEPLLPISVKWFGEKLYIINTINEYNYLKHKEIVRISKKSVNTLKKEVNKYIISDNVFEKDFKTGIYLCKGIILDLLGLLTDNSIEIEYKDNNQVKSTIIKLESNVTKKRYDYLWEDVLNIGRNDITFPKDNISYQFFPDYKSLYLQINSFKDKQIGGGKYNFKEVFYEIFPRAKNENIKNLIIDLRNNTGGKAILLFQFLSFLTNENSDNLYFYFNRFKPSEEYFTERGEDINKHYNEIKSGNLIPDYSDYWKPFFGWDYYERAIEKGIINLQEIVLFKKNYIDEYGKKIENEDYMPFPGEEDISFDGNIYVLSGSNTKSAGACLASAVKDNKYGKVIGENTGGSSIFFTNPIEIKLPYSSININIPTLINIRAKKESLKKEPDAVYPDVYTQVSFEDYLNGVDPCWEYIVENVFNK